jgi:hypothetical protein
VGDDNIWMPEGCLFLKAGDTPSRPDDAFLTH